MKTLIQAVDMIQEAQINAELDVCMGLADVYSKQVMLLTESTTDDLSVYPIFQEAKSEKPAGYDDMTVMEKAKGKGRDSESLIKKILLFLPRLFKAIWEKIAMCARKSKTEKETIKAEAKKKDEQKAAEKAAKKADKEAAKEEKKAEHQAIDPSVTPEAGEVKYSVIIDTKLQDVVKQFGLLFTDGDGTKKPMPQVMENISRDFEQFLSKNADAFANGYLEEHEDEFTKWHNRIRALSLDFARAMKATMTNLKPNTYTIKSCTDEDRDKIIDNVCDPWNAFLDDYSDAVKSQMLKMNETFFALGSKGIKSEKFATLLKDWSDLMKWDQKLNDDITTLMRHDIAVLKKTFIGQSGQSKEQATAAA